jgi:hypothetical protein
VKSLSDMADSYDEWARKNQAVADEILDHLSAFSVEFQERHRERASSLTADAVALRAMAAELRKRRLRVSN